MNTVAEGIEQLFCILQVSKIKVENAKRMDFFV